jgi:hypothetical protein
VRKNAAFAKDFSARLVSPNGTYMFSNWTATNCTLANANTASTTCTMTGAGNASVTAKFRKQ